MAVTKNLFMDQGSDFSYSLTANDSYGNPLNISSGYTATAQLRRSYYSSTSYNFITSITGGTGGILISLGATSTAALKAGRYVYDVELQYPDGKVFRLVQGNISVDPEVTK